MVQKLEGKDISCCNQDDIDKLVEGEVLNNVNKQIYRENPIEKFIKKSLDENLSKFIDCWDLEFDFHPKRICQYSYDTILKLTDKKTGAVQNIG